MTTPPIRVASLLGRHVRLGSGTIVGAIMPVARRPLDGRTPRPLSRICYFGFTSGSDRPPIAREFGRARTKLVAMARSPRFDQDGVVPPKHKESLVRSLGNPDKRFVEAGVVLGPDDLIAAVRVARSPDLDSRARTNAKSGAEKLMLAIFKFALGGILSRDPEFPAEIDQIIANATDTDLTIACSLLNLYRAILAWLESKNGSPEIAGFLDALLVSFSQPEYVAFQFALLLRFLKLCPLDSISVTQASEAILGILYPTKSD